MRATVERLQEKMKQLQQEHSEREGDMISKYERIDLKRLEDIQRLQFERNKFEEENKKLKKVGAQQLKELVQRQHDARASQRRSEAVMADKYKKLGMKLKRRKEE